MPGNDDAYRARSHGNRQVPRYPDAGGVLVEPPRLGQRIRYRKIALACVQQLPHIARPVEVLWDVEGTEGLFGIDIVTTAGTVRLPWCQIAHTLVAAEASA